MLKIVSEALRDAGIEAEWERMRKEVSLESDQHEEGASDAQGGRSCSFAPTSVTWTRAARRKRTIEQATQNNPPLFHARIRIEEVVAEETHRASSPLQGAETLNVSTLQVSLSWVKGQDRAVVESLWAFLVRKIGDAVRLGERGREAD